MAPSEEPGNARLYGLIARVALRPARLPALLRAGWRFRARGWWRRPPFLPLPPREYVDWRLHTAYGSEGRPSLREVDRYLRWANRMSRRHSSEVDR